MQDKGRSLCNPVPMRAQGLHGRVYTGLKEVFAGNAGGRKGGEGMLKLSHSQVARMAWKTTLTQDGRERGTDGAWKKRNKEVCQGICEQGHCLATSFLS